MGFKQKGHSKGGTSTSLPKALYEGGVHVLERETCWGGGKTVSWSPTRKTADKASFTREGQSSWAWNDDVGRPYVHWCVLRK